MLVVILHFFVPFFPFFPFQMDSFVLHNMTASQRSWLLNNPALQEAQRKIRAGLRWTLMAWWVEMLVGLKRMFSPLPTPALSAFPPLLLRLREMGKLPVRHRESVLEWVTFMARERPDLVPSLLAVIPDRKPIAAWKADIVQAVALSGRVALLAKCMRDFRRCSLRDADEFKTRLLRWISSPSFMKPRIAKLLVTYFTRLVPMLKEKGQRTSIHVQGLWRSRVILGTISQIAPWLTRKLPLDLVLHYCISRRHPEMAAALLATPFGRSLYLQAKLRAVARLAWFFRHRVTLAALRQVNRGDCAVCWNTRILWSLHGERRHAVCGRCVRRLRKAQHQACPVCRAPLH